MKLETTILDKYLFKQVALATIVGVLMFIVIWISPEILFKIIRNTIYQEITVQTAVKLFFLEIPEILGKAIPVGLMLGSLFVFDRLSKDSELTIIRGVGVSLKRLFVPIIALSLIGAVICYIVYAVLIPYSTFAIKKMKNEVGQSHFIFLDKTPQGKPKNILIVGDYSRNSVHYVKFMTFSDVVSSDTPLMKSIITSYSAEVKDDHWLLRSGIEYKIAPNGVYEKIIPFETKAVLDKTSSKDAAKLLLYSTKKAVEMPDAQLLSYMALLKKLDMQDEYRFALSKYYQRAASALGCVLFAICGVLLGFSRPRENRVIGFTLAVALIFVYYIILPFIDMLAQTGTLFPLVAAWFPNLIIIAAIWAIIKYKEL
jgi:lipopolysaccharide export system permease protein